MIAILTDFGVSGPYIGQMRAVLYSQAPGVDVLDLFPDLPACNVQAAAYLLPAYTQYLAAGTVCLCVVDPGVGTERRPLALQIDGRWFVGPDNGLFSLLIRRAHEVEANEILWRPEALSDSFHGRDLFAPIAAGLAMGNTDGLEIIDAGKLVMPDWPDELGEVLYLDSFGNAITGLAAAALPDTAALEVAGNRCSYSRTFAEAGSGGLFWYRNSNGLVEIAMNKADASIRAGIRTGDTITLASN
ncbi:hypothetical protein MNBD_GAMMA15-100 [hydrothermal vent metagenome]|uniref:Adenosyl-chloride synthase n=1 Tax=hydrothermal vent metagenome TaxID=652676 RepID=A0A3B0YIA4_9ZZZZ